MKATILMLCVVIFVNTEILSVDVLAFAGIVIIMAYSYNRQTKWDTITYIIASLVGVVALFVDIQIVESGTLGYGLLSVVMFTGVLPNGWTLTKKLRLYRSYYSILGVIFILPHAYINLFLDQQINIFGIASMVIMLPLFITSFNLVKKEIKLEEWVKLQKAAYLVYGLLFIHLISVADWYGKIVYAVMMTLYINNKLLKEFRK